MYSQFSSITSEQDCDLFSKQHDSHKYDRQHYITVFQHLFAENTDSYIIFLSKENSCNIRDHTDDSSCQHFNDQQNIIADSKYCHSLFADLIHNDRIQPKCFYKVGCHEDKHRHACHNGFFDDSKITDFHPDKLDVSFIRTNVTYKNYHCDQETKYR